MDFDFIIGPEIENLIQRRFLRKKDFEQKLEELGFNERILDYQGLTSLFEEISLRMGNENDFPTDFIRKMKFIEFYRGFPLKKIDVLVFEHYPGRIAFRFRLDHGIVGHKDYFIYPNICE